MAQDPKPDANSEGQKISSAPSISLPKGGGAIRGIGEKFAVNPVTGTGSLTVPIAASPGRSGFGPQLSLSYDSGAGNGPFGFGWHMALPSITRKTDKGLPRYLDDETFRRVYESFALAGTVGISASALLKATTNNPDPISDPDMVRDFESALRARYDAAARLQVVQPINDGLRTLRRDALVAYVFQQFSRGADSDIDTPDKLFEYFLMDVETDACMQTSRIRHALSSVQLFIERCLMNLEPKVAPLVL